MNTSFSIHRLTGTALVASLIALAGGSQAAVLTVSATLDPTNVTGSSTSGASSFSGSLGPLASLSGATWDDTTELLVTKSFVFTIPFTVTVGLTAPSLENYFKGTPVTFGGVGTVTAPPFGVPLFTQSFTIENLGSSAKLTYNGSDGTVFYTSDLAGKTYSWSAKFEAQPSVMLSYGSPYVLPEAKLNVTLLSAVPEPTTAMMLALGLAPLLIASRRRRG